MDIYMHKHLPTEGTRGHGGRRGEPTIYVHIIIETRKNYNAFIMNIYNVDIQIEIFNTNHIVPDRGQREQKEQREQREQKEHMGTKETRKGNKKDQKEQRSHTGGAKGPVCE